jgi:hypothetical protein
MIGEADRTVGVTLEIHAVVDYLGRLIAFEITPGQLGDVRVAEALLAATPAGLSETTAHRFAPASLPEPLRRPAKHLFSIC